MLVVIRSGRNAKTFFCSTFFNYVQNVALEKILRSVQNNLKNCQLQLKNKKNVFEIAFNPYEHIANIYWLKHTQNNPKMAKKGSWNRFFQTHLKEFCCNSNKK